MTREASADARRPAYPIESVDNALSIILLLEDVGELRLADVSERLGVASSTAHRLMAMLTWRGFVRQDPGSKSYLPGPTLTRVAFSIRRRTELVDIAQPLLERLSAELGETTHLGLLEGSRVRMIAASESTATVRVASRLGKDYPAHATAVGKAILASLIPEHFVALYPSEALEVLTPRTVSTRTKLQAQLERARRDGFVTTRGESEDDGVAGVAVVVPTEGGFRIAINAAAPAYRMPTTRAREIAVALRSAAAQLVDEIG